MRNLTKIAAVIIMILTLNSIWTYSSEESIINGQLDNASRFVKLLKNADLNNLRSTLKSIIIVPRNNNEKNVIAPNEVEQYILDNIHNIIGIKIVE